MQDILGATAYKYAVNNGEERFGEAKFKATL